MVKADSWFNHFTNPNFCLEDGWLIHKRFREARRKNGKQHHLAHRYLDDGQNKQGRLSMTSMREEHLYQFVNLTCGGTSAN